MAWAPLTMVRSLYILKRRPCIPTRSWAKNGVPRVVQAIASAASATMGAVTTNRRAPTSTSIVRFSAAHDCGTRRSIGALTAICIASHQKRSVDGSPDVIETLDIPEGTAGVRPDVQEWDVFAGVVGA